MPGPCLSLTHRLHYDRNVRLICGSGLSNRDLELAQNSIEYLFQVDGCGCPTVHAPLVEKFSQEGRNDLLLKTVVMNFPWTRAIEEGDAASAEAQSKVHGQTVAADKTTVVSDVSEMFQECFPAGQDIDNQTASFKFRLEQIVIRPILHRPDRTRFGGDGDVARQICPGRLGQAVRFPVELKAHALKNQILIGLAIFKLEPVADCLPKRLMRLKSNQPLESSV